MTSNSCRMEALMKAHKREKGTVKLAEDYLEAVYEIFLQRGGRVRPVDIARALNVAPSTVKKVLFRLGEKGYIRYERYRLLELTEEGLMMVQRLKRRHDTVSRLLQTLGMDQMTAEIEAERMEHSLGEQSTRMFQALDDLLRQDEELCQRIREEIRSRMAVYENRHENTKTA
ncbi:MAG: metal-dependent transcriptional regulator [Candidatus Caldarchaeum sp.]